MDLLPVDHQKGGRPKSDEILRGNEVFVCDELAVDKNAVAAAQIFDKDLVFIVDDQSRMLPRDAQILEDDVA